MKKIVLLLVFALSVSTTKAWVNVLDQSAMVLASQNLTPAAQERVKEILKGGELKDHTHYLIRVRKGGAAQHTRGWNLLHLDSNLQPVRGIEKDALTQLELAAETLRSYATNSDSLNMASLELILQLVPDMHTVSNVRIEGVPYSQKDFSWTLTYGKEGTKAEKRRTLKWNSFWQSRFAGFHSGFSPEFYAEDYGVAYGAKREEFQKGTPADWAHDIGVAVRPLYDWAAQDYVMCNQQQLELEDLFFTQVAKAGYRIAALLNDIFK